MKEKIIARDSLKENELLGNKVPYKISEDTSWDTVPLEDSPLVFGDLVAPAHWAPIKRA